MSRIGKKPVSIPKGVKVSIEKEGKVVVEGPKGLLKENIPAGLDVIIEGDRLMVNRKQDSKEVAALHGLLRALIHNMIDGVSKGFEKRLEIMGVGYRVALKDKNLEFLLGFSHPVVVSPPEGISFKVDGQQKVIVMGVNKQQVGETAAYLKSLRRPEPYKGKGIRYEGEHISLKAGKKAK
jgi:large subunit ribosomal protein L6